MNKKTIAAAIAAAPLVALAVPGTSWATTDKHFDGCPKGTTVHWVYKVTGGTDHKDDERYICIADARDGKDGKDGKDGAQGPAGPQGPKGEKGDSVVGPQGPQGEKGEQGEPGAVGPQGPAGVAGNDGAVGQVGPVGPKGEPGEDAVFNYEVSQETENCANGGVTVTVTDGNDEGGGSFEICHGTNGKNGENGTSKTVIVHQDGTTEEVPTLPKTGAESDTAWMLGFIGAGILAAGAGALYFLRDKA